MKEDKRPIVHCDSKKTKKRSDPLQPVPNPPNHLRQLPNNLGEAPLPQLPSASPTPLPSKPPANKTRNTPYQKPKDKYPTQNPNVRFFQVQKSPYRSREETLQGSEKQLRSIHQTRAFPKQPSSLLLRGFQPAKLCQQRHHLGC